MTAGVEKTQKDKNNGEGAPPVAHCVERIPQRPGALCCMSSPLSPLPFLSLSNKAENGPAKTMEKMKKEKRMSTGIGAEMWC